MRKQKYLSHQILIPSKITNKSYWGKNVWGQHQEKQKERHRKSLVLCCYSCQFTASWFPIVGKMKGSRFFPFFFILVSCDVCSFLFLFLLAIFSISVKCSNENFFLTIFYLYLLFHARLFVAFNDAVTNL